MTERANDHQQLAMDVILDQASQDEIARFDALLTADPEFERLVSELRGWLAPLDGASAARKPPPELLRNILDDITADTPTADRKPQMQSRDNRSRDMWRLTAIAASVVAAVAIGLHLLPAQDAPSDPDQLLALLAGEDAPSVVVIVYDPREQRVLAQLTNVTLPADGSWQLWLIREGRDAPESLGLLERANEDAREIELTVDRPLQADTDTLAVSLEPRGGSPEAGPTGPILFTGAINRT